MNNNQKMKKLLWLPGFIFIWVIYFFPKEWGRGKNVSRGTRWWNHRDTLAPIFSMIFYFSILLILVVIIYENTTSA